jgi:hypothetical protein
VRNGPARDFGQIRQILVHQRLNAFARRFSTLLSTEIVDKSGIGSKRLARVKSGAIRAARGFEREIKKLDESPSGFPQPFPRSLGISYAGRGAH